MGERNFGIDSLKSMNRDMEKKRIVLRELSCRTASELPAPELPAAAEAVRPQSGSSGGAAQASVAVRKLRHGELGGSPTAPTVYSRS